MVEEDIILKFGIVRKIKVALVNMIWMMNI